MSKSRFIRINERIRAPKVRVIGANGEQLGVCSVKEGLESAREAWLDLVEVAPTANPPVCRIMDYNKYKYEQAKKEKEARKKQHFINTKEIKVKPNIEEHDYQVKLAHIKDFLKRGDRVKVTLMFRGRQLAHRDIGEKLIGRIQHDLSGIGQVDKPPVSEWRNIVMTLAPKH